MKIYQHENFLRELFLTSKFPDLHYVYIYIYIYISRLGVIDVTGLYPVGYYGLHHTAAQLLWSLIGNRFCVIVAHWYSLDRLSFSAISIGLSVAIGS